MRISSFNYSKLRERIMEKCSTQSVFASYIGLSDVSLSNKLNNDSEWRQSEIEHAIEILDISPGEIHLYFFSQEVEKTQHRLKMRWGCTTTGMERATSEVKDLVYPRSWHR